MQIGKKTVIFLLIFSIISISITIATILYTKHTWTDPSSAVILENKETSINNNDNNNSSNLQIDTVSNDMTSLNETYKTNALTIKNNVYRNANPIQGTKYSERLKITYPEILGLADINIRTNINNEIREKVFSMYSEDELNNNNIHHIEISATITASFSDVLSVKIMSIRKYSDGTKKEEYSGLNYTLENGEQIKFKNLFIVGASIKNILRHSAYNSFAWEYKNDKITNMKNINYSNIDDMVFKALNDYSKNENQIYWFDEKKISIQLSGKIIEIPMIESYEQIAIYKKYVSGKQLYSTTSIANNVPLFVDRDEYSVMDIYMVIEDNLIIDISLNASKIDTSMPSINTALENYKKALNDSMENLKKYSKENKSEYTYFISRITAETDLQNNKLIFKEDTYRYIANSKTQYEVYITSPILNTKRTSLYGKSKTKFDLDRDKIKIQKLTNVVEYNLTTGELYGKNKVEENNNTNEENNNNQNNENNDQNKVNTNETNSVQGNNNTVDNSSNTTNNNVENNVVDNNGDEDDDESTRVIF